MYEIKRAERLSNALVHLVIARASLFTDNKISGPQMRAKFRHFRKMCEQTFDNSPTDPISSSLNWCVATLYSCWVVFESPIRNIFHRNSLHDLPHHKTMRKRLCHISQNRATFLQRQQIFWIQTYLCNCPQYNIFAYFKWSLMHPK